MFLLFKISGGEEQLRGAVGVEVRHMAECVVYLILDYKVRVLCASLFFHLPSRRILDDLCLAAIEIPAYLKLL
jgi:hypothetical protein